MFRRVPVVQPRDTARQRVFVHVGCKVSFNETIFVCFVLSATSVYLGYT